MEQVGFMLGFRYVMFKSPLGYCNNGLKCIIDPYACTAYFQSCPLDKKTQLSLS